MIQVVETLTGYIGYVPRPFRNDAGIAYGAGNQIRRVGMRRQDLRYLNCGGDDSFIKRSGVGGKQPTMR